MSIGFKRLTVGIFDESGKIPEANKFVIEGKQDKGATQTAEISGLSKEPVKTWGSNIAYYVSQTGTGDVSIALTLIDVLKEVNDKILGYKVDDATKISYIGEDTQPPYCSILLESNDLRGNKELLGFFKGKFSKDAKTLSTSTDEDSEIEGEEYTFSAISSDGEGTQNGQVMGQYIGSEETSIAALSEQLFPAGE